MRSLAIALFIGLLRLHAAELPPATTRTFYTGHSFAGAAPAWLGILAQQAQITGYENLGRQALGGSRVIDHWKLADARNQAKAALIKGGVDVLTLSPNMQMPDEGIDLFVDLALKHNPNIRILVQGSWMTWDGLGKDGIKNSERDARPVAEIRGRTAKHMDAIRTQLRATNARVGREVCTLIPVGTAVVRLRELIAEGRLPGFDKPSQLFVDDLGHTTAAVQQLCAYLYHAAVFHRDPREVTGLGNNGWSKAMGAPHPDLGPLLKKIAWETMLAEPMSGIPRPTADQVQTATTHPMRYRVSLPPHWSPDRKWPVLIAPSAHYGDKGKSIALFAAERDARKAGFIIVAPFVINADPVRNMVEYRGPIADAIAAADAALGEGERDEVARAKFDEAGVCAVIRDVQRLYQGEDKVYITGFSSSTHVAYQFIFTHPELLKGAVINSGVYLGRGVDEDHLPLLNSPERAGIAVKFIIGENDPGHAKCSENWLETRELLLRCGHTAAKLETEVIKQGNAASLGVGHQWYPTRILDFCAASAPPLTAPSSSSTAR